MKRYNYYNLNQKMIKIRKKIPALVKKRYSDEVDYDFVKIDDIYSLLTPALNKYGVDFEIIGEVATQKDADRNPVFLTQADGFWKYEADLEICWTNADSPGERKYTQIHVIGTHEVPEKAKGTAWTYGLKYYLLNRFSVKQGGFEDPDMTNYCPKGETGAAKEAERNTNKKSSTSDRSVKEHQEKKSQKPIKQQVEAPVQKEPSGVGGKNGNALIPQNKEISPEKDKPQEDERRSETPKASRHTGIETEKKESDLAAGRETAKSGVQMGLDLEREEAGTFEPETEESSVEEIEEEAMTEEDFQPVDSEEVPFFDGEQEEGEFIQNLREEIQESEAETEEEKARKVRCDFGLYSGKTLGEMMESPKGKEGVKWIAQRYRGSNTTMKEAAKLLIGMQGTERHAA